MMMRTFFLLLISSHALIAQDQESPRYMELSSFYFDISPEFILMHTDRQSYAAGETIYYKLHLFNQPYRWRDLSTVVYVTLEDTAQNILTRQKLRTIYARSTGNITLPKVLPPGKYLLKAFTLWMQESKWPEITTIEILVGDSVDCSIGDGLSSGIGKIAIYENTALKLDFSVPFDTPGVITGHHRDTILFEEAYDPKNNRVVVRHPPYGRIQITLWDSSGKILMEDGIFANGKKPYGLKATLNKERFHVRDKVVLEIEVLDSRSKPLESHISLSVLSHSGHSKTTTDGTIPFSSVSQSLITRPREMLMYPVHPESLDPIPMNVGGLISSALFLSDELVEPDTFAQLNNSIRQRINNQYGKSVQEAEVADFHLPYDNEYIAGEYPLLSTVEDLLKEVIPNIRVKTRKGKADVRIINMETKGMVFKYPENPLLIIDGRMYGNWATALRFELHRLEKINMTWKANTTNLSTLGSLANNGIISMYTRDGLSSVLPPGEADDAVDLFSTYAPTVLADYSEVSKWNAQYPDVRSPVYWDADIAIEGKEKIVFYTSDETGRYYIRISGMTNKGAIIDETLFVDVVD